MSVREHPTKPGHWIVDCRPSGYMGKRERLVVQGNTRVQALDIEKSIMRRHVDMPSSATAKTIAAIYPIWISYYKANRAPWSVVNVEGCWNRTLRNAFGKLQPDMAVRVN